MGDQNGDNESINDVIDEIDVISVETDEHKASKVTHKTQQQDDDEESLPNGTSPHDEDFDHPFRQSNDTSDLRLIVEGKPLYVSKVVLSLVSPVLKRMFSSHDKGGKVEMVLPGKKYTDLVEFLYCVYPDTLAPVTDENVHIMIKLAWEYQVRTLMEKCEQFLIKDIEKTSPKPNPEKIVHFLNISDKYDLDDLQKATFETAAKTESDLLENVNDFWDLPSVTTTSVFIRRLKILEQCGKSIRTKIKEIQNHCSLYHKVEGNGNESVCTKCYANIGRQTQCEIKGIYY